MTATLATRAGALAIDVVVESPCWDAEPAAEGTVRSAIAEAARALDTPRTRGAEVVVALSDDATVRELNRRWRGLDKPTNVLSFPAASAPVPGAPIHLGDIAIAYETTAHEAKAEGKPLARHLAHLAVHGFLHLLGYDHESEPEAERMEGLERDILARLGMPDPYLTHETGA